MIIGLIDTDLLDNGTRHPNLALMKIAGFLRENNYNYRLVKSQKENLLCYDYIFVSKVFSFSKEPQNLSCFPNAKITRGGTGYYADITDDLHFNESRTRDLNALKNNDLTKGLNYVKQKPDYSLYDDFISKKIAQGFQSKRFKDYLNYSIGFLTKGCPRQCFFCVNRNASIVEECSSLSDFLDFSRPFIYLWDDNFLAYRNWKDLLQQLQDTQKPFQFRQGLDIRLMTEEKAKILSRSKYHGDYTFAFDNILDRTIIENKLALWRKHTRKDTKLYLFCGYNVSTSVELYKDIRDLFVRIRILIKYGCLPYVMRHENFRLSKYADLYTQIARWCNQPQIFKKMSFREFCERNQQYRKDKSTSCVAIKALMQFTNDFADHNAEINNMFDMKYYNALLASRMQ
jgi:hypothetical protein